MKINKTKVYETLIYDDAFTSNYIKESILVSRAWIKESWFSSIPEEKQRRRRQFLASAKKRYTVINLIYYEKMIEIYDQIIKILSNLEEKLDVIDNETTPRDLSLLRITALMLIEKDFIDEHILPKHHAFPSYFQGIAQELDSKYPDLHLKEFAEKYTEMFESWPEKSQYEIKKS